MTNGFSRLSVKDYLNNSKVASEYIKALEEKIEAQAKRIEELEEQLSVMFKQTDYGEGFEEGLAVNAARTAKLEMALDKASKLYNSVNGSLDAFEHELCLDMGNTNYNCIKERLHEFEAARKVLGEQQQ